MSAPAVPVLRVSGASAAALAPEVLRALPAPALERYLAARRWYGGKGRAPRAARVTAVVPLPWPACPAAVAIVEVAQDAGRPARYQLPLATTPAAADAGQAALASAALATIESDEGRALLVDATALPCARAEIGRALARGAAYEGEGASYVAEPLPGAAALASEELANRVSGAEQSNTSLIYGDRAILKLYRRLEPGENPDVEIARFLTTRTSFRQTPPLLGVLWLEQGDAQSQEQGGAQGHEQGGAQRGERSVAGMLTGLVPGAQDAWAHALAAVEAYLRAPGEEPANPFAVEARRVGETTRALHDALASAPDDADFAPLPATAREVAAWGAHAGTRVEESTTLLGELAARGRLPADAAGAAQALVRRAPALLARAGELARAVAGDAGMRLRHHGDYHLGQLLRAGDGSYAVIDFEGEPARPLAERRERHSPLRDVAGMLRSFAYAAASGAQVVGGVGADAALERRMARWERAAREAFLAGYGADRATAPYLPRTRDGVARLIALFELEKVAYELMYELNNRPDWAWIPMRGLGRMLGSP